MNENKNICPCCGKGCDLSAPRCPRGEEYARTGNAPSKLKDFANHEHCHGHHHGPHHRKH